MNFETYRIFYYTARYKNITGAAKALFLTQPTVSHAIAGLEKELGCQLFIRSKKGVQMTPEAELLYRHLSKAFQHVEDGEQSLRDHLSLSEGQDPHRRQRDHPALFSSSLFRTVSCRLSPYPAENLQYHHSGGTSRIKGARH